MTATTPAEAQQLEALTPRASTTKSELHNADPVLSSKTLFAQSSTIVIEHLGMHYTLRVTRNGKLILTK